jgi:hypothetical protein
MGSLSCKDIRCKFWEDGVPESGEGGECIDDIEMVIKDTGEPCCRYHPDAVLLEEWEQQND